MTTINLSNSSHANLSIKDIKKIKDADDRDIIKFRTNILDITKTYTVSKSDNGNVLLKYQSRFYPSMKRDKIQRDMNLQLSVPKPITKVTVLTLNAANKTLNECYVEKLTTQLKYKDTDVVIIAEQESKHSKLKNENLAERIAKRLDMAVIDKNEFRVMTKINPRHLLNISRTGLTMLAKPDVDIKVTAHGKFQEGGTIFKNKGGVSTTVEIDGMTLRAVGVHLDSNSEMKRSEEIKALLNDTKKGTELLVAGDHNYRYKNGVDPLSSNQTIYKEYGIHFNHLGDNVTYKKLDEDGCVKRRKSREESDIGQLDNVGISNNSGRISKMNSHVLTHIDASDHKPVISTGQPHERFLNSCCRLSCLIFIQST